MPRCHYARAAGLRLARRASYPIHRFAAAFFAFSLFLFFSSFTSHICSSISHSTRENGGQAAAILACLLAQEGRMADIKHPCSARYARMVRANECLE